jgi:hypothetical protein
MLLTLLIYLSSIIGSNDPNLYKSFNTIITIHYTNEADKKFTKFQQYDKFFLNTYGIVEAPAHIIESEKLKTTIKLNLDKPSLLLLGFDEFYIEPNNNLDISFIVLKHTKTEYKDSIKINHGVGIVTRDNGEMVFLNKLFANQLKVASSKAEIEDIVSEKALITEATNSINKLYLLYPAYKESISIRDYFREYFKQYYFSALVYNLNIGMKNMSDDLKSFTLPRIKTLSILLSHDLKIKLRSYWFGMNKVFNQMLNPEFKKSLYSYQLIKSIIKDYDSITQQFFFLLSVKASYTLEDDNKTRDDIVRKNLNQLIEHVSYPEFMPYIKKFKSGNSSGDFINDDIKNCVLYDYDMQQIRFNDLFTKSSQQYILFDFCGSWCKPCLEELKEYKISKKLDTSSVVKPIWIFFENNNKDWLKVIEAYKLKKENCFLLQKDSVIQKNFSILFSWLAEFPHHFLFNNQGKIVDNNVLSLSSFEIPKILASDNKELGPPLPPEKND